MQYMNGWFVDLELGQEQVVRVKGDVDFLNSPEFSSVLSRAIEKGPKVIVDLSQAEILDSTALTALSEAVDKANRSGVKITLTGVSDGIQKAFQITGLAASFGLATVKSERHKPKTESPNLNRQDWSITESVVLAEPEMIFHLRDLGISSAQEAGMGSTTITDIKLALTEALTYALKSQSSTGSGTSKICLRCMGCSKAFVMEITDVEHPDKAGGYAISSKLIDGLMDEVSIVSNENGSYLRLLKWIKQEP
jgi:anti-anti-sigma factor